MVCRAKVFFTSLPETATSVRLRRRADFGPVKAGWRSPEENFLNCRQCILNSLFYLKSRPRFGFGETNEA
jgi:hypothetical protein